eukprot:8378388-Heterocapsa_arctica.AAC.1
MKTRQNNHDNKDWDNNKGWGNGDLIDPANEEPIQKKGGAVAPGSRQTASNPQMNQGMSGMSMYPQATKLPQQSQILILHQQ